jgi:hypothetical protein
MHTMKQGVMLVVLALAVARAQDSSEESAPASGPSEAVPIQPAPEPKPDGVQWRSLLLGSFTFMAIEHGYRYATEPATRHPERPFFQGYIDSVGALHGWADGDPFYVNYVGHPMQGAVSGFLWIENDRRYRYVHFGANADYWKSRLRAGAFAWVYSEQMEIGPISEASIGNIQASFPQQGLVDHVVTPLIGLGWLVTEDALDNYLIRAIERRTGNRFVVAVSRGGLNPSRSLVNVISGQWPWARVRDEESLYRSRRFGRRIGSSRSGSSAFGSVPPAANRESHEQPGVPTFELAGNAFLLKGSSGPCTGGGATAAFRIAPAWQIVLDVNGCKMWGLRKNLTGDSLTYMAGARWNPSLMGPWRPYLQVLAGGNKLTQELLLPNVKLALSSGPTIPDHNEYTHQVEADGFAAALGAGLDLKLSRALAFRVVEADYTRSWVRDLDGFRTPNTLQVKAGFALRFGNW